MSQKQVNNHFSTLQRSAMLTFAATSTGVVVNSFALAMYTGFVAWPLITSVGLWGVILLFLWRELSQHPYKTFGAANTITLVRAAVTSILAGLILIADQPGLFDQITFLWLMTLVIVLTLLLDGVDGYVARKTGQSSAYGARFDMEIDALLALVIALLLWQSGKTGIWVLGLGLMRYVFVLASIWLAPLRAPLYPSQRRKVVCVIQLAALIALLSPLIQGVSITIIGWLALVCLGASFGRDILWLYTHQR